MRKQERLSEPRLGAISSGAGHDCAETGGDRGRAGRAEFVGESGKPKDLVDNKRITVMLNATLSEEAKKRVGQRPSRVQTGEAFGGFGTSNEVLNVVEVMNRQGSAVGVRRDRCERID